MVDGLVDVEFNQGIDTAHSTFENLLRVQWSKVKAQIGQTWKVIKTIRLLFHIRRWCFLIRRRRRTFGAVIDFLFAAVALLVHRYHCQVWLTANSDDVFMEDVQQRVWVDSRVWIKEIATRFLDFQVSNRTGLRRILVRKQVHLTVVVLSHWRCVCLLIIMIL